jgi:four helix bundle protein
MEKPHKRLEAWKRSMELAMATYRVTRNFPAEERFGLTAQMRGAAVSVPSNIAEGAARRTAPDFVNFLHTARASLSELDTQLELALAFGYVDAAAAEPVEELMTTVDKTLSGLIKSLRARTTG